MYHLLILFQIFHKIQIIHEINSETETDTVYRLLTHW